MNEHLTWHLTTSILHRKDTTARREKYHKLLKNLKFLWKKKIYKRLTLGKANKSDLGSFFI